MGCVGRVGCVGYNRMMGVNGDANGEWLVKIGSFRTKVGWWLSGGYSMSMMGKDFKRGSHTLGQ